MEEAKKAAPLKRSRPFRLEIGLGHAVGAALHLVLGALLTEVAARLTRRSSSIRQRGAATQAQWVGSKAAGSRQLHTGSNARSSRYGLGGIGPENHGNGELNAPGHLGPAMQRRMKLDKQKRHGCSAAGPRNGPG